MPRYEDLLEPAAQMGVGLATTLTGEPSPFKSYEDALEPPLDLKEPPVSPEQRKLTAAKRLPTTRETTETLLRGSGVSMGGIAGSETGAALLTRAPWLARILGSGVGQGAANMGIDVATGQPPDVKTAGLVAAAGVAGEAIPTAVGYGASRVSGVPSRTIQETLGMSPTKRISTMYGKPPLEAELLQSDAAVAAAKEAIGTKTTGRLAAEQKIRDFDVAGTVDTRPLKQYMMGRIKSEPWRSEGQKAANTILQRKISELPDDMHMQDFDEWITEHTKPVSQKIGTIDQQLPTDVRKGIVSFARSYRNRIMPEAQQDFAEASRDIKSFKNFRKQVADIRGDPKTSVESIWRRVRNNQALLRAFQQFDESATRNGIESHFADDALQLARKRDWTSDDIFHAYLILRGAQRFLIRPLIAKPSLALAHPTGIVAGGAMAAFENAMEPESNP